MAETIYQPFFNEPPYYNDFDPAKNFYQMGYVPARAVQARELTQTFSVLQNQIACAGSVWYRSGTPVSGCRITVSYDQPYFKIGPNDMSGQPIDPSLLVGLNYTGNVSGQMIHVIDCDVTNRYLYFSYLGGSLSDGEMFTSTTTPTRSFYMSAGTTSTAINAKSTAGILFVDGYYIQVPEGNIMVATTDQNDLYNIGFSVVNEIVTEDTDASLNDNSAGSTNFGAPGAHRLKIVGALYSFKGSQAPEGTRFISGITIENGRIIKEQSNPLSDTALIDLLAKRTYDESGSYTVNPWKIQLYDIEGNTTQYRIGIQEGLGYVRGYEVNTIISNNLTVDKPRDSIIKENTAVFNDSGCYCLALQENGVLSAQNLPAPETNVYVKSERNGQGTTLGEATILNYVREGSQFRVYLINASSAINSFNGARSLVSRSSNASYINLYINESNFAELNGNEAPFIYSTGEEKVQNIVSGSMRYQMVRRYSGTSEATGHSLTILETDTSVNMPTTEGLVAIYSDDEILNVDDLIMTPNNTDTTSSAIISGDTIQPSTAYTVYIRVTAEGIAQRAKVLTTATETLTVSTTETSKTLKNADILDIVAITQSSNTNSSTPDNLVSYLTLNNGQSDYYYNLGSISGFNSATLNSFKNQQTGNTQYQVTYRYFIHSGSGPFTVDSYTTNQNQAAFGDAPIYDNIPTYTASNGTTYDLRDCFDYRVKAGDSLQNVPIPRTELISDVSKYLPRIDALYVASNGEFGILQGIASEDPQEPTGNDYIMILYYLENDAYVRTVKDVTLRYVDNRRYTMKDIGKLNTRLTNVEDTVSMSQLEQSAMNMQITDTSGLNRYKTGIFTDNFGSFDNADYTNSEWECTIDSIEQSVRANFNCENIMLRLNEGRSTNIVNHGKVASLPYTTEIWAENTFVTDTVNVQNLLFYSWKGNCKLTPSIDTWVNDLGQFVVSETYVETPKPPSTFRTWSTTEYITNHRGENWGFGWNVGKAVTTTYSQETAYTGTWAIQDHATQKESQDEFMRQTTVTYEVTGLRPGVPVTATLDDKAVTLTNNVPDTDGNLTGTFVVPEKIPCGTKLFAMQDADSTSTAETYYTAKGKTTWTEIDRTYIREWNPVTLGAEVTNVKEVGWDPVAESIYIEDADGIYVDSVDIYFAAKDSTNVEVWCYIVECENGMPTTRSLPFSMVSLPPSAVNVSETGTVPTNFKFECPIYLEGKKEYAIIVATTSYEYNIFISTLGHPDLNTGIGVHEQPYLGNMFMSQNTRTWIAETQSDMTFRLHKCVFDTSVSGVAVFNLDPVETDLEVAMATLVSNVFTPERTNVTYEYRWNTESNYTPFNNYSDIFFTTLKEITAGDTNTSLDVRITISTTSSALTPEIDLEDTYGIFTNNILKSNTDEDSGLYPYVAGVYVSKATTLKYASDNMRVILDAICPNESKVDVYVKMNTYNPTYVLQSTKGSIGISKDSGEALRGEVVQMYYYNNTNKRLEPKSEVEITGYSGTDSRIYLRAIANPDDFKQVVAASASESQYTGIDSKYTHILLIPIFSTTNISVDNWNNSKTYNTGEYVFSNGFMWQALRDVEANQMPSEMSISWKLIHTLKTVSTVQSAEEVTWRPMSQDTNTNTVVERASNFIEYTYYPTLEIESEFQTFSVKLVLKSKDKVNVPRVRNLRAIATM